MYEELEGFVQKKSVQFSCMSGIVVVVVVWRQIIGQGEKLAIEFFGSGPSGLP
jgi:hypothetical protein